MNKLFSGTTFTANDKGTTWLAKNKAFWQVYLEVLKTSYKQPSSTVSSRILNVSKKIDKGHRNVHNVKYSHFCNFFGQPLKICSMLALRKQEMLCGRQVDWELNPERSCSQVTVLLPIWIKHLNTNLPPFSHVWWFNRRRHQTKHIYYLEIWVGAQGEVIAIASNGHESWELQGRAMGHNMLHCVHRLLWRQAMFTYHKHSYDILLVSNCHCLCSLHWV